MLFNSLAFLGFLPVFCLLYFATRGQIRLWVCVLGSYYFYAQWDWRFLSLILVSTVVDFVIGLRLDKTDDPGQRKWLLLISMAVNLGILGFFKYCNFFIDSFTAMFDAIGWSSSPPHLNVILPVGISFYTFQTMSYTIDVFRRKLEVERSLLRFATYVAFFPQLVAGPIVRASQMLPQLRVDHALVWDRFLSGGTLVVWGLFLKVAIADSLALVVDGRFENPAAHSALSLAIGVVFYAFQIYCDFNGYSTIAIGVARILGFDFLDNFNRPYFSASFSEFWQRWHISLSTWLRDYIYIPLGGNHHGVGYTYRNLMLTMLLGGLWHGAAWRFVLWGGLHGLYLVAQRVFGGPIVDFLQAIRIPQVVCRQLMIATVFCFTCIGWVFFRAESASDAFFVLQKIFRVSEYQFANVTQKFHVIKGGMLIAGLVLAEWVSFRVNVPRLMTAYPVLRIVGIAFLVWSIAFLGTFGENAFIYFQF